MANSTYTYNGITFVEKEVPVVPKPAGKETFQFGLYTCQLEYATDGSIVPVYRRYDDYGNCTYYIVGTEFFIWEAVADCNQESSISFYESGAYLELDFYIDDTPGDYIDRQYESMMCEWYGLDIYTPIPDPNLHEMQLYDARWNETHQYDEEMPF